MDATRGKTLKRLLEPFILSGLFSDGKYETAGKAQDWG